MPIRGMEDKREKNKDKLRELAFVDDLTELYNRRYLYQYLPAELQDTRRLKRELSLFMIDVDNFKGVNDTYGHLCGDRILIEIAEILRESFREGDTVVRYGGDEFIAILPGAQEKVAVSIAKRILKKISDNLFKESKNKSGIHVTVSIGLGAFPRDSQEPRKLIHQADQALYSSKHSGRNRICTTKDISAQILNETKLREIFPCSRLVSRQEEINKLKRLLGEAEKREVRFALIKGERGIGKTRLINGFKTYAGSKGITGINVFCSPEISRQPYQALIMALESIFSSLGQQAQGVINFLSLNQAAQLANYIPSLKEFLPENIKTVKASTEKQAQIDLFKGICQSLIYIVKKNTLLLTIDDFQWVDKGTLQLFHYIVKNLHIPILIVAAYQEKELEERADGACLKELFKQLGQNGSINEITLNPLEKEDVLKMVTTIFAPIRLNPEFLNNVYDVGMGNPLFTEEILRFLLSKGFIIYRDKKWQTKRFSGADLPSLLKEAIQRRISSLDRETKTVVSAAAVIGEAFDFDVLCQLLGKDEGYILEVMDRAGRQHLITPQGSFQTDKFRFNSETIRGIIYAELTLKEKQNLHRRLALIEEKACQDNVNSIAGTLGYHFAKARDTEKANLYTNILLERTKWTPTYEDTLELLRQASVEEAEEIAPLSDVSMKLAPALIRSLRLAAQSVRLYPPHSSIRKNFINQVYKYLTKVLQKDGALVISAVEAILLINGEEMSEKTSEEATANMFLDLMAEHRIRSITFKKDLTEDQLEIFLEGVSQNYHNLASEGGLAAFLRKNNVSLIRVNAVRYEQTGKLTKQRNKFEDAMFIDYLIGKVSNIGGNSAEIAKGLASDPKKLAETLKKIAEGTSAKNGEYEPGAQVDIIAKSLERLSEQVLSRKKNGTKQYRKNIAEAMMALDYSLRCQLIQTEGAADKRASKNIIKDLVRGFSDEQILKMATKDFSNTRGNLENMRNLVRGILSVDAGRKQKLLPKLKNELVEHGLSEEEIFWVLEEDMWQGLSLKEKAEGVVKLSPDNYIKLEASKQIDDLISQLLKGNQHSQISKVINKLLGQLKEESGQLRTITLKDLSKISKMLISKEKSPLLEQIVNGLVPRLDAEKEPSVYSLTTRVLAAVCAALIKKQNFVQAAGILKEFNLRLDKTAGLLDIQKQAIKDTKETVVTHSLIDWLIKLLKTEIDAGRDFYELSKVIEESGRAMIEPLYSLAVSKVLYADPFKEYTLRWGIANILKGAGDDAILFLKEKLLDRKVETVKIALELLGHMQNKSTVKYLEPLLKRQDLNVRKEAITALGKIDGSEAIKLLSEFIKDKNGHIQLAAIRALANTGSKEAIPLLKPLLQQERVSQEVKKAIQKIEKGR